MLGCLVTFAEYVFVLTLACLQDLVSKLSPNDFTTNIGVLQVAHSIFERWRPLVQSNELYVEINHVLERFGLPYMKLFEVKLCPVVFALKAPS